MKKTFCVTLTFILAYYFLVFFIASCVQAKEEKKANIIASAGLQQDCFGKYVAR